MTKRKEEKYQTRFPAKSIATHSPMPAFWVWTYEIQVHKL
jgi:hypothetical protein